MANSQRSVPPALGAAVLFVGVFALLFGPVVAGHATFAHGDALSVSLPLQTLLASALEEGRIPLWSDAIYGGHPIFAEGQGGFLHPLNLLLFGALPRVFGDAGTLYGHGLLHVICAFLAAFGTFGLCRALGLGVAASLFAGLALAASQDWLGLTGNSAIALSTSIAPLALWALERWWRAPGVVTAGVLGAAVAAMLLAGYPQAVHAFAIFAGVLLLVRSDATRWRAPGRHLATGLLAVAVAAGLSAVQLLPTLELAGQSVRAGGVELAQSGEPALQLRGLLFGVGKLAAVEPGLGSLLVLLFAGLGLRAAREPLAWLLATLVLFQLGLADRSPLYSALHGVLPGLDSFRITHLYSTVGLIGVAVLAGYGVQRLCDEAEPTRPLLFQGLFVAVVLTGLCLWLHDDEVRALGYAFPVIAAVGVVGVVVAGGRRIGRRLPMALVVLLLVEIALVRPRHALVDIESVRLPPPTVAYLQGLPDEQGFRVANVPRFFSYIGFASPDATGLDRLVGLYLSSLDAGSNLLWGVPSLNANLALPLARREAVEPIVATEVRGESPRAPGTRFIDAESVRWVVARDRRVPSPYAPDLTRVFEDEARRFFVLENPAARPRVQLARAHETRWVPDAAAAAKAFAGPSEGDRTVLEGSAPVPIPISVPVEEAAAAARLVSVESSAERYAVVVEASEPVHLVVADAPYPGWTARLDGAPVPIVAANLLGKAVAVSPGRHRVELDFEPGSFRSGAWISGATAAVLVGLLLWPAWRRRRSPS